MLKTHGKKFQNSKFFNGFIESVNAWAYYIKVGDNQNALIFQHTCKLALDGMELITGRKWIISHKPDNGVVVSCPADCGILHEWQA